MHSKPSAKLSRRHLVNIAAAATTLSALASQTAIARARGKRRSPIVLVHPAWHGGWCWKKITSLLRLRGYDVYAPTLTGLGERSHLLRREIGLDTHVEDVVGILKYEDLTDAVLVGHSSSGMVVTSVADRVPGQVRHIVYLDAFIPEDGQSLVDLLPPNRRRQWRHLSRKRVTAGSCPVWDRGRGSRSYESSGASTTRSMCAGCWRGWLQRRSGTSRTRASHQRCSRATPAHLHPLPAISAASL